MNRFSRILIAVLLAGLVMMMVASSASARLSGAVWTTTGTGDKVNGNLYDQKCPSAPPANPCASPPLVPFLNGGPNFAHPGSWVPDGCYYFQVTDPGCKVLLSTDPIEDRMFCVYTDARGAKQISYSGPHQTCTDIYTGVTTIALCPFLDTPNNGGVYKLWITRVGAYTPGEGCFGFIPSESKTDNFKVKKTVCIWGDKRDDAGDPLQCLHIILYRVDKVRGEETLVRIADTSTNAAGEFSFCNVPAGRYCVKEDLAGTDSPSQGLCVIDYSTTHEPITSDTICFTITKAHTRSGDPVYIGRFVNRVLRPPLAALAGRKFLDANGNGLWEAATEPPLAGWKVCLDRKVDSTGWEQARDINDTPVPCQVTAPDGTFNFGNLPANMTYLVRERLDLKPGWKQTAPNTGPSEVIIPPGGGPCGLAIDPSDAPVQVIAKDGKYIVTLGPASPATTLVDNLCFGNKLGSLCVQKLLAVAGTPLQGWEFRLYEADGTTPATDGFGNPVPPILTGSDGKACWSNLLGGTYVVKETVKNGWVPVSPASGQQTVTLAPGEDRVDPPLTFTNRAICIGLTPGYWKNWRNHYTDAQFCTLLQGTIADVGTCAQDIAAADAIFEHWDASPDDYMTILKAFLLADQLTLNLTQNPGLPNPSGGSLLLECTCGTGSCVCGSVSLGDAITSALAILANPGSYSRDYVLTIKNQLAAFAEAYCP